MTKLSFEFKEDEIHHLQSIYHQLQSRILLNSCAIETDNTLTYSYLTVLLTAWTYEKIHMNTLDFYTWENGK